MFESEAKNNAPAEEPKLCRTCRYQPSPDSYWCDLLETSIPGDLDGPSGSFGCEGWKKRERADVGEGKS